MFKEHSIQKNIITTLKSLAEVLRKPWYGLLAAAIFLSAMLLAIWMPNLSFVKHIILSSSLGFGQKINILVSSLGAIQTNFTFLSRIITVSVSALFAIQVGAIVFYLKRRVHLQKAAGISSVGIISGFLGVGCATCGSVILSAVFGVGATASFIGFLPLQGQEFGLLSITILGLSLYLTSKNIQNPLVCGIRK